MAFAIEYNPELWIALRRTLSKGRQKYYLNRAFHRPELAFGPHQRNTQLSEALYVPLQAFEIALRNALDAKLTQRYGAHEQNTLARWRKLWCVTPQVKNEADVCSKLWSKLRQAKKKLEDDQQQKASNATFKEPDAHSKFVAAASFGFWVHLLDEHYADTLWSEVLSKAFPNSLNRGDLFAVAKEANNVRNQVMHYEPVFEKDLLGLHNKMLSYIRSWCPKTAEMVAATSRFEDVWQHPPSWLKRGTDSHVATGNAQ